MVRLRAPGRSRSGKGRWIVHVDDCQFAPGSEPLDYLLAVRGEAWILSNIRSGVIARCATCRPTVTCP